MLSISIILFSGKISIIQEGYFKSFGSGWVLLSSALFSSISSFYQTLCKLFISNMVSQEVCCYISSSPVLLSYHLLMFYFVHCPEINQILSMRSDAIRSCEFSIAVFLSFLGFHCSDRHPWNVLQSAFISSSHCYQAIYQLSLSSPSHHSSLLFVVVSLSRH